VIFAAGSVGGDFRGGFADFTCRVRTVTPKNGSYPLRPVVLKRQFNLSM
jgi:hypothetical protein